MKHARLWFALVIPIFVSNCAAQLKGQVLDTSGAVIPKAHIVIHWDSVGLEGVKENVGVKDDKVLSADDLGRFSTELPPGVYDVFVSSSGFQPACTKLSLKRNKSASYKVKLRTSRTPVINLD